MKRALLLCLLALGFSAPLHAQQDPQYTMFMFNKVVLNPAFAGYKQATHLAALGRSQWVGIPGHPTTFTLSGDAPIYPIRSAVGGHVVADILGPLTTLEMRLNYAFRIPIGEKGHALQIGISPGFFSKSLDGTQFDYDRNGGLDPVLIQGSESQFGFNFGAGIAFYMAEDKMYAGVAANNILEPTLDGFVVGGQGSEGFQVKRNFTFIGGYRIDLNPSGSMSLEPSTFIRFTQPTLQADINLNFNIRPMVFGISHRLGSEISGLIGFNATRNLFVAYAYDYTISSLSSATSGSHEVVVTYTFPPVFRFRPPDLGVGGKPDFR